MKQRLHLILVCAILAFVACSERREYREALSRAEAAMADHPDSALLILDSLGQHEQEFGRHFRMQYLLHHLNAQNKTNFKFTSDSLAKELVDHFDSHGTTNERVLAHYLLGRAYSDMGEAPQAIDCYQNAVDVADTTVTDFDFYTLGCVYSQMATIYRRQLLLTNEIEARKKASHYDIRANQIQWAIYNQVLSSGAYILLNKKDSAEIVLKSALEQYRKHGYIQHALRFSKTLMNLYTESPQRLTEAKALMDEFDNKSDLFDEHHELPPSQRQYYDYKGKYFEGIHQLDSAEYYYRRIYFKGMDFVGQDPMFRGLLSVFTKRHQADSIAKYARLYGMANDSSIALKDRDIVAQISANYNYSRYQLKAVENEKKFYQTLLVLIGFIVCFFFVIIAVFFAVKRYKKIQERKRLELIKQHQQEETRIKAVLNKITEEYNRKVKSLEILEKTHRLANLEAARTISELRTEKDNYQTEFVKAQQTIAEANANYDQEREKLTNEIASLSEKIESYKREQGVAMALKKKDDLEGEPIIVKLRTMAEKPKEIITENDFVLLEQTMSNYYPALILDLKQNPKFSNIDRQVCIMTALKFRPGDIVNLTDLTSSKVTNAKEKVNLLLFGSKSASSLYQNLVDRYDI